jgi:hypothetical protein
MVCAESKLPRPSMPMSSRRSTSEAAAPGEGAQVARGLVRHV